MSRTTTILSTIIMVLIGLFLWSNFRIEKVAEGNGYRIISLQEKIAEQEKTIDNQQRDQEDLQDNVYRLNLASRNEFGVTVYGDKANFIVSLSLYAPFTGGPSDSTKYGWGSTCVMGDKNCDTIYLLKVDGSKSPLVIDSISLVDLGVRPGDEVEAWYAAELTGSESLVPSSPGNNSPSFWRQSTGLAIAITHVDGSASGAVLK